MKKITLFLILALIISFVSYSKSYEELLAKGMDYEAKKEYVYALGYYYDAMNCENKNNGEADAKFNSLSAKMRLGTEGLGLSLWDDPNEAWRKVVMEFHKYFTEFSPYEFYYGGELQRSELDYKNKTASYTMKCFYALAEKFIELSDVFGANIKYETKDDGDDHAIGYNWYYTAKKNAIDSTDFHSGLKVFNSWGNNYVNFGDITWVPYMRFVLESIDNDKYETQIQNIGAAYQKDVKRAGIDTVNPSFEDVISALSVYSGYEPQKNKILASYYGDLHNEILKYYKKNGIALSLTASDEIEYYSADSNNPVAYMASFVAFDDNIRFEVSAKQRFSPYDLQFGIYDNSGRLLATGNRQCVSNSTDEKSVYIFSGVPESAMNIIEKGEYSVRPLNAWLNYGVFRSSGFKENASTDEIRQSYLKNAAEIKQDIEKIKFVSQKEQEEKKTKESNYLLNSNRLSNLIDEYLENFKKLGFAFDEKFNVIAVVKNSPAQKAGIKVGNQLKLPWSKTKNFYRQYIIDDLDLKAKFQEKEFENEELKKCIKLCIGDNPLIYNNAIVPLEPGSSITFTVISGKKSKDVTLTVPY